MDAGVQLAIDDAVNALLEPVGAPRDGVTIVGGEPMAQPNGLAALVRRLKALDIHTAVYTGFTLEALASQRVPAIRQALEHTDLLIDSPYIPTLADGAGEWRGSRNQRLIWNPGPALTRLAQRWQRS
jgi:organic radical activating enzyme